MKVLKAKRPDEQYRLDIGDKLIVDSGFFFGSEIMYAGIVPPTDTYSFIYTESSWGEMTAKGNLYFPKDRKTLGFSDKIFNVLDVNENQIILQYVKKIS
jgi:hypothetical protein